MIQQGRVVAWQYEAEEFWFDGITRGVRSYKPDFRVELPDGSIEFHEIKGWMDAKSRTALDRMKRYHPDVVVKVFDAQWFRGANRGIAAIIPGWERG